MDAVEMEPLTVTGPVGRKLLGIGTTKWFALIKAGKIELVEIGGRKMPTYRSIKELATPKAA